MGENAYMYGRSASSGLESMNRANERVREHSAVDLVNATILLLKVESEQFETKKAIEWETEDVLTPKGEELRDQIMADVMVWNYMVAVEEYDDYVKCQVSKSGCNLHTLEIPMIGAMGLRFGLCTCEGPKVMGLPCKHMFAVVKSGKVVGLESNNVMPFWWMTQQMRLQYPIQELIVTSNLSMRNLEKIGGQGDQFLWYCPAYTAPNKSDCPSPLEKGKRGKKKRSKTPTIEFECNHADKKEDNIAERQKTTLTKVLARVRVPVVSALSEPKITPQANQARPMIARQRRPE